MINFWKLSYEAVKKQRDQLKQENKKLKEEIDTSQVSRLIAEKEQLKQELEDFHYTRLKHKEIKQQITALKHENKALRLQADTYFDEWQSVKNLYTTLTSHIRLKAENNPGVSRYIDLVNYVDRLERD